MQIIIKVEGYTYMYDSSEFDTIEDGEVNKCFLSAEEAVDIALSLLGCSYGRRAVAKAVKCGNIPALDYYNPEEEK